MRARNVDATPPLVIDAADDQLVDVGLAQHPFHPRHVERRIGDLLDREIRRHKFVDQLMAPAAGREVTFLRNGRSSFEMRRDDRLAAFARHQREMRGDDKAAGTAHRIGERLQLGRQRRDGVGFLAGAP